MHKRLPHLDLKKWSCRHEIKVVDIDIKSMLALNWDGFFQSIVHRMNAPKIYHEKAEKSYCMLLRWIYEVTLWKACEIYKPKSKYNTTTS